MLEVVTPGTIEPLTVAEVKTHLQIASAVTDEDTYIGNLLTAAREQAEDDLCLAISPVALRQHLTTLSGAVPTDAAADTVSAVDLERFPLKADVNVVVKYLDANGTLQTLNSANYAAVQWSDPQRIEFSALPSGAYTGPYIEYTAGWAAANVPKRIKQALLFLLYHWYENREAVTASSSVFHRVTPLSYRTIIRQMRRKRVY